MTVTTVSRAASFGYEHSISSWLESVGYTVLFYIFHFATAASISSSYYTVTLKVNIH